MPVFRITLRGEGLRIRLDDAEALCGFYKTEFLRARDADQAIERACAAILESLRQRDAVNQADVAQLRLSVDEVQAIGMLGLLQRQGFVFYKLNSSEEME